jgi:hypothetical protein
VAGEGGVNLICFVGGALNSPERLKIIQSNKQEKLLSAWSATRTLENGLTVDRRDTPAGKVGTI